MTITPGRLFVAALALSLASLAPPGWRVEAQTLPASLSDRDFWNLVESLSEADRTFVTDNRISNELAFQHVIPELRRREQVVYLGVGPEQNFTYITALKPRIAFIVDIRRQNLLLHLAYKALVEMSSNRTEFLSRLFARPRPGGTGADSSARVLFNAYVNISPSDDIARATLREVIDRLEQTHGFSLSEEDERGIEEIYRAFYLGGPFMRGNFGGGTWIPTYAELMAQTDLTGHNHSFLASEENFQVLKDYHQKNLIVPVVGDFSGVKALKGLASYLTEHGAAISTFYASNVEEYLFKSNSWSGFARNLAALPRAEGSMFIRTYFTHNDAGMTTLLDPIEGTLGAFEAGEIRGYNDVVFRSKLAPRP